MEQLIVYFFAFNAIIAALAVITAKNPIHAILYLVLVFLNASGLLLILSVEFLAMIFLIVYIGAIAILFLFVVMLLNIKSVEYSENLMRYLPVGGLMAAIFFMQIYNILQDTILKNPSDESFTYTNWIDHLIPITNIEALGQLLYTEYFYFFLLSGVVLLVAMVAAIILTMRHEKGLKRQNILEQIARKTSHIINHK